MHFSSFLSSFALLSSAAAYVNVAYYTSYSRYDSVNYFASDLPASSLTHVKYAFAKITENGTVIPGDAWADYESDPTGENNAYGNVADLFALKVKNRNLKVLLSIGGQDSGEMFYRATMDTAKRPRFAKSAVKLMADYGFDGIDLDYEFPSTSNRGNLYYKLMQRVREELDTFATKNKQTYRYTLTAALPAGPQDYSLLPLKNMGSVLDQVNVMTYELCGIWNSVACHHAPLYQDKKNPSTTPLTSDQVISHYISQGVPASKINIGMPLYGRVFLKTKSGMGSSFDKAASTTWQNNPDNLFTVKGLPKSGATEKYDSTAGAWYSESNSKTVVTYEGESSAKAKAAYVKSKKLGGAMFWEASMDRTGSKGLITVTKNAMGSLTSSQNNLDYPTSEFLNIRTRRGF